MKILLLGAGQIGNSIISKIIANFDVTDIVVVDRNVAKISYFVSHFKTGNEKINIISRVGDIFMPYDYFDSDVNGNLEKMVDYFYSEDTLDKIRCSSIYSMIKAYKPDLVVDAMNSATSLGSYFKNENSIKLTKTQLLFNDFVPKISNYVFSLLLANKEIGFNKYIKISTTGLGGMGLDIPFTHGDESKLYVSNTLIGKISAAGTMNQMLLSLYHTKGNKNIVLIIPSAFVGYEECEYQYVDNNSGYLEHCDSIFVKDIDSNNVFSLEIDEVDDKKIKMVTVRAGENHVYSKYEMSLLAYTNQMKAITKEEIADLVVDNLKGLKSNNLLEFVDNGLLHATYSGRIMIEILSRRIADLSKNLLPYTGIATGNLGLHISKKLYELYIVLAIMKRKNDFKLELVDDETRDKVKEFLLLNKKLIDEILANGLSIVSDRIIIKKENSFDVSDYAIKNAKSFVDLTSHKINYWVSLYNNLSSEFIRKNNDLGEILAEMIGN